MGKHKRGIYNTTAKEEQRKALRNSLTIAEAVLWKQLKDSQLAGRKFRRQESIGPYIADFYCPESRLIVELDGRDISQWAAQSMMPGGQSTSRKEAYE